jgi:arsenate reductase
MTGRDRGSGPTGGTSAVARPLRLLFVCVGNSCRSQMAEGLARAMGGDRVEARSAGTSPGDKVAPKAVEVMRELGIDISHHRPKALTEGMLAWADRSFTMGCDARDMCPAPWLASAGDWRLDDPVGLGPEKYRAVRDEIAVHLRELFDAEGIPLDERFRGLGAHQDG